MSKTKLANPNKLFPLFVVTDLDATRRFYLEELGWLPTYDLEGYLQVRSADADGPELAFMTCTSAPAFGELPSFEGRGVIVSVPVADADEHHAGLRARGLEPLSEPSRKPWGWQSYMIADPNGVLLDFFHVAAAPQIEQATA